MNIDIDEFTKAGYALLAQISIEDNRDYYCVQDELKTPVFDQVRVALRSPNAVTISWRSHGMFKLPESIK